MSSSSKKKKKVKIKSKQNKSTNPSKKSKSKKKMSDKNDSEIKSKKQRQKILEIRRIQSLFVLPAITDQQENKQESKQNINEINEYTPCIVCGLPGVGKRTLLSKIQKSFPNTFGISVSHENNIKAVDFIQYVYKSIKDIKSNNLIPILNINVDDANAIKTSTQFDAYYLFITCNGGLATLRQRMKQRNTETDQEINQRLCNADKAFTFLHENSDFFDCVISNDDLQESSNKLIQNLKKWYSINTIDEEYDNDNDSYDNGSVILLELTESQENDINDLEIAFEEYDEDYYGFCEYDKFLSILKQHSIDLNVKQETFLMLALVLVDEGVDYYEFLRILRHKAAESPNDSLLKICQQIAIETEHKSNENNQQISIEQKSTKESESNTFYEATQTVRSRGMSLMAMPKSKTVMTTDHQKIATLDGVEIDYTMLKNALAAIGCKINPNDDNLIFLMNYLALSGDGHIDLEKKKDADGVFIDFNYFLSFCQEVSNIPATRWQNTGKIIQCVARQTRIIYRTKQRGKRDKLKAIQRLENRKKVKQNKKKNNMKEMEAEEKRQRTLRLRQKAKTVSKSKSKSKQRDCASEERLKLNEWMDKRGKKLNKKIEKKDNELKKWMQTNNIFSKKLLAELNNNNVKSIDDLKSMNRIKLDKILRNVRVQQFEKVHNENSRKKMDKLLVKFEKKWRKLTHVSKKSKTK